MFFGGGGSGSEDISIGCTDGHSEFAGGLVFRDLFIDGGKVVNLLTVFLHTVFEVIVFTKKCRDIQECFDDGRDEGVHGLKRAIGIEPECSDKGFENVAEFFEILAPVFGFHIFDVSRNDKESIEV